VRYALTATAVTPLCKNSGPFDMAFAVAHDSAKSATSSQPFSLTDYNDIDAFVRTVG